QFIVEEIGEELVESESIYPPGVDAHTYEPTTKEMTEIAKSDAFIYFGPTMEGFVESAGETLEDEAVRLISLEAYDEVFEADQLEHMNNEESEIGAEKGDEVKSTKDISNDNERNLHVWIDPLRMMAMTEIITAKLIEMAPEHEQLFEQNKQDLIVQLQ